MTFRRIQHPNLITTNTSFDDPVIVFGKSQTSVDDIGFLAKKINNNYAGLIRDSDTNSWILIDNYTQVDLNSNDIDADDNSLVKGTLEVGGINIDTKFVVPVGTTEERPSLPTIGEIRFNTTTSVFEGYDGTQWVQFIPTTLQITNNDP